MEKLGGITKRDIFDIIWMSISFIIILILIIQVYRERDCINGKHSKIQGKIPLEEDDLIDYTRDLKNFVHDTTTSTPAWIMSLLIAMILSFIVVYLIKGKLPNFIEYILSVIIIFTASYFAMSWNDTHFINPNVIIINKSFDKLIRELDSNGEEQE